jgi:hypothetical protein
MEFESNVASDTGMSSQRFPMQVYGENGKIKNFFLAFNCDGIEQLLCRFINKNVKPFCRPEVNSN